LDRICPAASGKIQAHENTKRERGVHAASTPEGNETPDYSCSGSLAVVETD
jgi:hypothetical protein